MRRLWTWIRARRWWGKTLIAVPAALLAVVGLYVAARGLQYLAAGGDAREYVPAGANFSCGIKDLDGEWDRLDESAFWNSLEKGALKDRAFRARVNEALKEADLPTLDQLQDRRWQAAHPEYERSTVVRMAGRDVAAGLRVSDDFGKAKFLVATKVRFGDYLLLPFAGMAAGLAGAKKDVVAGRSCLKVRSGKREIFVVIEDAYVIASDDRGLLTDGLRKKGKKPKLARPLWIRADFTTSAALAKWRNKFRGFPLGAATSFMKSETARTMEVEAGVQGSALLADVRLDGVTVVEGAADPAFASYAPGDGSLYQVSSAGMSDLYGWLRSLADPDPKAKGFDKFVQEQAKGAVKELDSGGFETDFLSRVGAPMALVMGSEVGFRDATYTTIAFVMRSSNAREAVERLRGVLQRILKNFEGFGTELRGGGTITYFNRKTGLEGQDDYLRPVMAEQGEAVILGNNLQFVRRVLDAGAGEIARLPDSAACRQARQRMKEAGFEVPGSGGDASGGFVVPPVLRQGLLGHLPNFSKDAVDTAHPRAQLRTEIEAELRKEGKDPTRMKDEVARIWNERHERLIEEERAKMEASLTSLNYAKWLAFGARAQGDRVTLRFMMEAR